MLEQINTLRARVRLILLGAGLMVFIIFLLQNTASTPLKLLFFDADIPVTVLVVVVALGSFAVGYYTAFVNGRRRRKRKALKQEAKAARQQAQADHDNA